MSLPFLSKKPIDLPPIISIELIQITEKTNIPFALKAKKISPEDAYDKGIVKDRFTSFLKKPPEFI